MPVFDYQGEKNTQLIMDALNIESIDINAATNADYCYQEVDGWKVIDGAELGYQGNSNPFGAFFGESFFFGGAECNVLGKYNAEGNLVNIGISFWGTGTYAKSSLIEYAINSGLDVANDLSAALVSGFADDYILNAYRNLMSSVADFATSQGLAGNDVIVSGYSLGGLSVNSLATLSEKGEWNGFFRDASYVAFASPTQNLLNDNVLNIGYENDPVFRSLAGNKLSPDSVSSHDTPLETCTNNIVTFNDYYAGLTDDLKVFSILNLSSWAGHGGPGYLDGVHRIMNSSIYDLTHQNSNIVVSNLSEQYRATTWVSDLNKSIAHTGSTFIVGTETNDLLRGGKGNDYLCGGGGDDTFKDHKGYNVIYGGSGKNTYITECDVSDFNFSHDADGNLFFKFSTGDITRAEDIHYVNTEYTLFGFWGVNVNSRQSWEVTDVGLKNGNNTVSYAESYYACEVNNFTVSAVSDHSWLYSGANDSDISVAGNDNTIVSGFGNDIIHLNGSDNTLMFYGDFGNDIVYNLTSSDSLIFMANQFIAENDSYLNHLSFDGDSALLTYGGSSVTLVGVSADLLSEMHIAVA